MPSINLRGLRNTKQLKKWLRAGQTVELRERDQVLGRIIPDGSNNHKPNFPDFEARAQRILGNQKTDFLGALLEDRWGERE